MSLQRTRQGPVGSERRADPLDPLFDVLATVLRDQVRTAGVDPQTQEHEVRRLAGLVVAAHDQRSLTGAVLPVGDADGFVDLLVADVAGLGPLQPYLEDPDVEEIWINEPALVR